MKKTLILCAAALISLSAAAQLTPEYYKSQYQRQVKVLGPAGVGVETIIDKWERVAPEDGEMLEARFSYYLAKSRYSEVVRKDQARYLGAKPVVTLKDSLGRPVNYFQEDFFVDSLFARSCTAIDRAIALYPDELRYRFDKISSLVQYEKESPDMALDELLKLIEHNNAAKPSWKLDGAEADEDTFIQAVQEYCFDFYRIGTPIGYEAFLNVSTRMSKLYPKNSAFVSNIGTYWLIAKDNGKKAKSFYKKALKLNPEDVAATSNMKLIQSSQSAKGRSSK